MKKYDYLIVGSGLFGSVFAYEAKKKGKKCVVIERRNHIGGNIYCENIEGITVHKYGAHIFHTNNKKIWEYVNNLCEFNRFTNSPVANYKGELYNLPFNMNTFSKLWGIVTPDEARSIIDSQRKAVTAEPSNLEEQAISLVGTDIYEKLIKGYTQKQWGRPCSELPAFIIKRLPVRYTYDNNYFNDKYQGIPEDSYNAVIEKLLEGTEVILNTDFLNNREEYSDMAERIVYTGTIDSYYDYVYGQLEYRSLNFESELIDTDNYQGVAVMNYTDSETPFTRIIEHKHFAYGTQEKTVITREYPADWEPGKEAYYPVNNEKNQTMYEKYKELADQEQKVIFGGRLGLYRYYDMDKVIEASLLCAEKELS